MKYKIDFQLDFERTIGNAYTCTCTSRNNPSVRLQTVMHIIIHHVSRDARASPTRLITMDVSLRKFCHDVCYAATNEHARVIQFPFLPLTGTRPFTRYARAYNVHAYEYIRVQGSFINARVAQWDQIQF